MNDIKLEDLISLKMQQLVDSVCGTHPETDRRRLEATLDTLRLNEDVQMMAQRGFVNYRGALITKSQSMVVLIDLDSKHNEFYRTTGALTESIDTDYPGFMSDVEKDCMDIADPLHTADPFPAVRDVREVAARVFQEICHNTDGLPEKARAAVIRTLLATTQHLFSTLGEHWYAPALESGVIMAQIVLYKSNVTTFSQVPVGAYMPEEVEELL